MRLNRITPWRFRLKMTFISKRMMWWILLISAVLHAFVLFHVIFWNPTHAEALGSLNEYDPTWESLGKRPLPDWYHEAKIGIFLHWGVYSVPSFSTEWFLYNWKTGNRNETQFMRKNFRPSFTYADFAHEFRAEFYDPEQWASVFNASGARYVILTSKHHEGYANWPSKYSFNWNSMDVGPGRDLVGDLAKAIRSKTPHIHFGLYYSLFEWFHPLYLQDKANNFSTNDFIVKKMLPEMYELVTTYKPEIVWSDGDWEAEDWYWNSTHFLAWLFNRSPVKDTVVVNDRWSRNSRCKYGSYLTCHDRFNPGVAQKYKWENCMTLDKKSWGYRRDATVADYLTIHELLSRLAMTISCGGNILINVGPTHDGMLPPIMEERLLQLGSWLNINGEAIYHSQPWTHQEDKMTPDIWFTARNDKVYAIVLHWPENGILTLGSVSVTSQTQVSILGHKDNTNNYRIQLKYNGIDGGGIEIAFPGMAAVKSQWAWVLVMSQVKAT